MSAQILIYACIGIPLCGAILTLFAARAPKWIHPIALITSATLGITAIALARALARDPMAIVDAIEILPGLPLRFAPEPLGIAFSVLAAVLWFVNTLYSIGYVNGNKLQNRARYYIFFALAIASTQAIALAGNLLTLFIFYEVLSLCTYPLVAHEGTKKAVYGARIYLSVLMSASFVLFIPALLWTWHLTGTLDFTPGGILAGKIQDAHIPILLALFAFGTGKAALMPVHRWLPAAMVAPTPVSALLHAVAVVKAGVFTIMKIVIYIFGIDLLQEVNTVDWLVYVAGISIVWASVRALRQRNLKARLAYSTISQLAYIVMATAILTPISILAAVLHIVAHAFGKITLFFAAGSIYTASHKTEIDELDGVGRKQPWTMAAFAVGTMAMIGLPPTFGFVSKWYLLAAGAQDVDPFVLGVIIISTLLNTAYFAPIVYRAFFAGPKEDTTIAEAPLSMNIAQCATALASLVCFFAANLILLRLINLVNYL